MLLSKNAIDRLEKKQNYDIRELLGSKSFKEIPFIFS